MKEDNMSNTEKVPPYQPEDLTVLTHCPACGEELGAKFDEHHILYPEHFDGCHNNYVSKLEGALRYIASPTLGRQVGTDPAEFVRQGGGSEHAIRVVLAYCITLAQQALNLNVEGK